MRFDSRPESIFFVGVTGGSCAGKSVFAQCLRQELGLDYCHILSQDAYYRDQSACFDVEGGVVNFDEPASIDFALLYEHLLCLQRGESIKVPIYDFAAHRRLPGYMRMFPAHVIILEGTLILTQPAIVELLTEIVFLDIPESTRIKRRMKRDIAERGCTREGILAEIQRHVIPMHARFVEPYKHLATYCITSRRTYKKVIAELVEKLGIDS